ncbi:hypothetical protein THIOKS11270013 [Thiocapsa sp. KS1]|nr:hypothetical protein THIOKS11270013 [Thiocapsa sp. KS1]
MVDDPSAHPDLFPTETAQEKERQRLFRIIEDLVLWENTNNEAVLQPARDAIRQSSRYTCAGEREEIEKRLQYTELRPDDGGTESGGTSSSCRPISALARRTPYWRSITSSPASSWQVWPASMP